ncbi:hypothetical protein [Ruegeria sp. HKCCD6604]|uniref:hypothetical protein n=1 Tax=Ruegeria sp. HKCCD6604 TaxID=2683000 RepID=UPI001491DAB5|nr:hypothetical protein [Ruegeria sp. HKCCD6604]NOC94519.1 hypothetical protein [Ruegeria sp. HKCCD6604]
MSIFVSCYFVMTIASAIVAGVYLFEFVESALSRSKDTAFKALFVFFAYLAVSAAKGTLLVYYVHAKAGITLLP